ncbi:MAG: restriction endonuclease subunit S [Anaerolineae bacterium]|nr:restriction endonuclease subunit S [Anaerolineae bacterium]
MAVNPGYKRTEVGVIPEDWKLVLLGDVIKVYRGGSPRPIQDYLTTSVDGVNWIKIGDVGVGEKYIDSTEERIKPDGIRYSREIKEGDFLLSNSMSFGRPYISRVSGCIHDGWLVLQNYDSTFGQEFLYYLLSSKLILDQYLHRASGSSVLNLNKKLVASVFLIVPSKAEQSAISEALSDVDAALGALDRLIAKKRDMKHSAMQELLTGKKRLPGYSSEWVSCILSDIGDFSKGKGITKDDLVPDGVPCVRYGEIYTHHNDTVREFRSFISQETASKSQRIQKGDLLFTGSGETSEEIGKCVAFLGEEEAYAGGDIVIFSPRGQNSMYLGYLMNHSSVANQKARFGQGDAVVHISARNLGQLELCLPSINEQTTIAQALSDMDDEIAALEKQRDKTWALKQGMMQELLTGKMRLI